MIYEFNGYQPVVHESSFVHELAAVTGNVIIGEKVYIGPGAAVRGDWERLSSWMVVIFRRIVPCMFFPENQ